MALIRPGEAADLEQVGAIQAASESAAHWPPEEYLKYDFWVAAEGESVAGFLVGRRLAEDEFEILNLAVAPHRRRQGVGRALVRAVANGFSGTVFLEVRASNRGGQEFYKSLGFQYLSRREGYYEGPPEAAIVMNFHSCYCGG
jgi:ribosomal-protein-alanine acetyltransferase